MENVKESRRLLNEKDIFVPATWRYMVKAIWLFFPPILFLLLAHLVFWNITQGKDLMVIALEEDNKNLISPVFFCFILALIFWVIVTWYTTRIVANARDLQEPNQNRTWRIFVVQTPRVLAFTCITIILLAFCQLEKYRDGKYDKQGLFLSPAFSYFLLAASYGWYYGIYTFWGWFLKQRSMTKPNWLHFLKKIRYTVFSVLAAWIFAVVMIKSFWSLITFLLGLQVGLVLLLLLRREMDEAHKEEASDESDNAVTTIGASGTWKKIKYIVTRKNERQYFRLFQIVSFLGVLTYVLAIFFLKISITIGSFSFILLAFGVLLGIGNFITTISVFTRFNFHLVFILFSLVLGHFNDPHFTKIIEKPVQNKNILFSQRQTLKQYFINWLNSDPVRQKMLNDTGIKKKYPVYFVMSNGGASRSGYWVASVLSKLQDTTQGKFSQHLFCLSGASGGSVGNVVFFNLLRTQDELIKKDPSTSRFWKAATSFLKSDFLSFTLTRLLGRDIFTHIIPLPDRWARDRANALAYSLERAAPEPSFLYKSFAAPFSSFITQKNKSQYSLPVLCINTTRMQDGRPGVISNISMQESYFNKRIDVLSLLDEKDDMKLSTAVVLGASFPYLSPAGRINAHSRYADSLKREDSLVEPQYFVDGGYFDNSGAGVVNEMMIALRNMMQDKNETVLNRYLNKLDFYVLHITNNDKKKSKLHRINPFTNDLLAPIQTMMGSYGTQTMVNDERLKNFLLSLYGVDTHYINIDLYGGNYDTKFSMNWVISGYQRDGMDKRLMSNSSFKILCDTMSHWKN